MSTYSMNTALMTTTHNNMTKNKKITNAKEEINLSHLGENS